MAENETNTSNEGMENSTSGEKSFTQEEVNRIVQDRLAKEKSKGNEELKKRTAELDKRERRMNAIDKLRENGLPDYLVDALNMETDEAFKTSMDAVMKMKGENPEAEPHVVKTGNPIGVVHKTGVDENDLKKAFGL